MNAQETKIINANSIQDVLEQSDLNFNPVKTEIMTMNGIECPDHCAIVRSDNNKVLSVMGKDYTPFAPAQTFAIADSLIKDHNLKYHRAVAIDGGRRALIELEGSETKTIGKDECKERFQLVDSLDGSKKFHIRYGFFRMICTNGLYVGEIMAEASIRHTKHAQQRLEAALNAWQRAKVNLSEIRIKMESLTQKIVDKEQVEKFLDELVSPVSDNMSTRKKNQREDIEQLFLNGRGNKGQTAWDLYNGAVEYYQHHTNLSNPESRLASHLFETGHKQSQKAFKLALEV